MSENESSSTQEYSDDTQQCIIEAMEEIIEDLQLEVITLKATIEKLNKQITTFQSIQHSDLINKILKYI
jgi:predicted RNase H-like nuclease (RuvC/YqgF family)